MQLRKIRLNVSKHLSGRGLKLFMGQCLIPASIVGEPALQCKVLYTYPKDIVYALNH